MYIHIHVVVITHLLCRTFISLPQTFVDPDSETETSSSDEDLDPNLYVVHVQVILEYILPTFLQDSLQCPEHHQ